MDEVCRFATIEMKINAVCLGEELMIPVFVCLSEKRLLEIILKVFL